MQSAIYEGQVKHTRMAPVLHRFRYRVFMMYLDLDELPTLFNGRWFWSARRAALARFRRADHIGPTEQPLAESVRDLVERETGRRPRGPIRLLTNLSYFGFCFNPVSYYYCYSPDGERVEAIVAEVTNTPWGECDTYVLGAESSEKRRATRWFKINKKMHVSPFMPMDMQYDFCFTGPGHRLSVYMANSREGKRILDASLSLKRTEITGPSLARVLVAYPFMTLKVLAAIHWQALRLWIKGCPLYKHPAREGKAVATSR